MNCRFSGVLRRVKRLAASVPDTHGVYFVPAFTGLGSPHWDMYARGLLIGLTRGTSRAHIVRAALEAMAYQTCDVINSMIAAAGVPVSVVRVDGGAAVNDFAMQFQSDMLQVPVQRPQVVETTALGAAYLAGLAVGYWESQDQIAANWRLDRTYTPQMSVDRRDRLYRGWQEAVRRSRAWATEAVDIIRWQAVPHLPPGERWDVGEGCMTCQSTSTTHVSQSSERVPGGRRWPISWRLKGYEVRLWARTQRLAQRLARERENALYLPACPVTSTPHVDC